jgi:hypothetical protein
MKRKSAGRKKRFWRRRYASLSEIIDTKRAQRKEEERIAKAKKEKMEKEKKGYDDMYGTEAVEKAQEERGESYDLEEDFW